jgi:hypothetical protein
MATHTRWTRRHVLTSAGAGLGTLLLPRRLTAATSADAAYRPVASVDRIRILTPGIQDGMVLGISLAWGE